MLATLDPGRLHQLGEHIVGGNGLVGVGLAALELDNSVLAEATYVALLPFPSMKLGLPWACSLGAPDVLASLADQAGRTEDAERFRAQARAPSPQRTGGESDG